MSKVSMDSHGNSFEEIIREVGKSIQCERIYIFEKNTDNTYDCTLEWCENPKDARKESMQHLKYECVRYYYKYFAEKKNLVIKNMDDLREENPKLYLILSPQQLHSVMAVQLKYGDEDLGFMGIDNPPVDKIEDYEPVLELVAYLISNLIKSRQTIELLNKMGYQDRLTGCGTRYSLFHDVDQLEMGTELCIIYADVMGLKKEEVLYVGDSETDIKTAKNAGLKSIGCLWGFRDRETLEEAGADYIVDGPAEILKYLGE